MLRSIRTRVVAVAATAALSLGLAAPAGAQEQNGLVNVNVSGNQVFIPIGVAANVCADVDVAVLVEDFMGTSDIACDAESTQFTRGQQRAFGIQ